MSRTVGEKKENVMTKIIQKSAEGIIALKHFEKIVVPVSVNMDAKYASYMGSATTLTSAPDKTVILKISMMKYTAGGTYVPGAITTTGTGDAIFEFSLIDLSTKVILVKGQSSVKNVIDSFAGENDVVGQTSRAVVNFMRNQVSYTGNYVFVTLEGFRHVMGEVRRVTDKELYITKEHTLYIVNIDKIESIEENDRPITIDDLRSRRYGKINYGKYPDTQYIK
jgi:hypothetical protein